MYKKIAAVVFGLFLALVFIEAILWIGNFCFFTSQNLSNRIFLRSDPEYKILCLGESTTALGGSSSWPAQLEKIINRENVKVVNKAIPGGDSSKILKQLESNLDMYKPKMVIVMMGVNDKPGILSFKQEIKKDSIGFLKNLKTYNLARYIMMKLEMISNKKTAHKNNLSEEELFALGWEYLNKGDVFSAEKSFKKVITLNPQNEGAYLALGDCCSFEGQQEKAKDMFSKALKIAPANDNIYVKLGWVYNGFKQYGKAEELFKTALKLNPANDLAYFRLGRCYFDNGKYDKAEEIYKKAIAVSPMETKAYGELAKLYLKQQRYEAGSKFFKQVVDIYPHNADAWGALGVIYSEKGDQTLAKKCLKNSNRFVGKRSRPQAKDNYNILKNMVLSRKIQLVCVQYPLRNLNILKEKISPYSDSIIFVDNEQVFAEAVKKNGYFEYFTDIFAGDFGHCTEKGNRLLAENIYNSIINSGRVKFIKQ